MRKLIHIVFVGSIVSSFSMTSCGKKDEATPIDPILENFKNNLIGKWACVLTQVSYSATNGVAFMSIISPVDCTKELQWDYLKSLTIESNVKAANELRVTNEYYCALPRTTFFELFRQKNIVTNKTFLIVEKDESGNMMKVYKVDESTVPTQYQLSCYNYEYDFSYFYLNKVGSIPPVQPIGYAIAISKQ